MNTMIRVATYSRVSTQEQADTNTSLDFQNDQLTNYCRLQGWEVFQHYVDPGFTGKDDKRPGLQRMLVDAKLGLFTKMVVMKLDRLSRNLRLLLEIQEKLMQSEVSIISVKESIDTGMPIGRTVFQVLGLVSEWERDNFVERSKSGRIQRYKEGCCGPGSHPYGYRFNPATKKLDVHEPEALVVRRIFNEYNSGKSMQEIANILNDEQIPTRNSKGKGWMNTSVRDVVIDSTYCGTRIVNVYQKIKSLPEKIPDTAIKIEVPPIVSKSVWDTVQNRRKNNKHLQPVKTRGWLLQGLVTCGLCGHGLRTAVTHYRRTFECRGRLKYTHLDGSPRCTVPNIDATWLEEQVWERVEEIINNPSKLKEVLEDTITNLRSRVAELNARIKPIDTRLLEISEQKARLAETWVQTNMNPTKYADLQHRLDQEEFRLQSIRRDVDPTQLEELEQTQGILRFWEGQINTMAWNTETESGDVERLIDEPHEKALNIIGLDDKDISKIMHFPATRRELLDMLQVRLIVFMDRIEVKAIFRINPIENQKLRLDSRWPHHRRLRRRRFRCRR